MKVQNRINLLTVLGEYLTAAPPSWQECMENAFRQNPWFTPGFIQTATTHITQTMLQQSVLESFTAKYAMPNELDNPKTVGIVLAGNIPFAGFHDLVCGLLAGHRLRLKLPDKASIITEHLLQQLILREPAMAELVQISTQLKNCDAYIATGSNNTSRYFEYYFGKYPHIIRHNRTAVAIITGDETEQELEALGNDVYLYFGLGCRNVTKIYVPKHYNFEPLLKAFSKYDYFKDHHKYRNNYDYQLALLILNKKYYMTNGVALLTENKGLFSPVSQLFYEYYSGNPTPERLFPGQEQNIQCIVGKGYIPFGQAQFPTMGDFADGVDTMQFFAGLN